jgi:hypothetical protein
MTNGRPERWRRFCFNMEAHSAAKPAKPYDIHARLKIFACDVVRAAQFLHTQDPIAQHFPTSCSNAAPLSAPTLRRRTARPVIATSSPRAESPSRKPRRPVSADELVRILGKIVHNARRNEKRE